MTPLAMVVGFVLCIIGGFFLIIFDGLLAGLCLMAVGVVLGIQIIHGIMDAGESTKK